MKIMKLILSVVLAVSLTSASQKTYVDDKVISIIPENDFQVKALRQFQRGPSDHFDFWMPPFYANKEVVIRVSSASSSMFTRLLDVLKIKYDVKIENFQEVIDRVTYENSLNPKTDSIVGTFPRLGDLYDWMEELCATLPSQASCGEVATTTQGRSMQYIKIGNPGKLDKQKIWIEGTVHAREWLAAATVVYMVDRMLHSQSTDPDAKRMMDDYDWYVIPIINPDGYEYSHTRDRLWRKTRSQHWPHCKGVDGNRNFEFRWDTFDGASRDPCSDIYRGPYPFSEPETKSLSEFILANKQNTKAYFSLHTYSQYWLVPYGVEPKPDDFDELQRVAEIGAEALMKVNYRKWVAGNTVDLLYMASGTSIDWTHGVVGMNYSYCLELRPIRGTYNGFVVNERDIIPSGREVWAGLIAAIDAIPADYQME